jgi:hypothetical protein
MVRLRVENEESYLQSELSSLGIESKQKNEFNDKKDLEALATAIKEVYFQEYRMMMMMMIAAREKPFTKNFTLYDLRTRCSQIECVCLCVYTSVRACSPDPLRC